MVAADKGKGPAEDGGADAADGEGAAQQASWGRCGRGSRAHWRRRAFAAGRAPLRLLCMVRRCWVPSGAPWTWALQAGSDVEQADLNTCPIW